MKTFITECKSCGKEFEVNRSWRNPDFCKVCFKINAPPSLEQEKSTIEVWINPKSEAIVVLKIFAWINLIVGIITGILLVAFSNTIAGSFIIIASIISTPFILVICSIANNLEAICYNTASFLYKNTTKEDRQISHT
jgi:hypothetical protein